MNLVLAESHEGPSSSMSFSWAASSIDIPTGTLTSFSSPSLSTKVTDILQSSC
jgi:hypothetical protein